MRVHFTRLYLFECILANQWLDPKYGSCHRFCQFPHNCCVNHWESVSHLLGDTSFFHLSKRAPPLIPTLYPGVGATLRKSRVRKGVQWSEVRGSERGCNAPKFVGPKRGVQGSQN